MDIHRFPSQQSSTCVGTVSLPPPPRARDADLAQRVKSFPQRSLLTQKRVVYDPHQHLRHPRSHDRGKKTAPAHLA